MRIIQQGYVLFIVLVFLQIFALMNLTGMAFVKSLLKLNQENLMRERLNLAAEDVLQNIENDLWSKSESCRIAVIARAALTARPLAWWQQQACHVSAYHYVVEYLGNHPCEIISMSKQIAAYYRITLFHPDKQLHLQSIFIKASDDHAKCESEPVEIQGGRQVLREI